MAKEDKQILVVERDTLFSEDYFKGFKNHFDKDYESIILSNIKSMRRGDAEIDPTYKQPIGYMLIVNPKEKKVFAYQRSSEDKNYGEKRLQGKWSWGVGGHIEAYELKEENPIKESMKRELSEEIEILGNVLNTKVLGYINYDGDEVSKAHFGILYLTEIDGDARPKSAEMFVGKLVDINELEKICNSKDCEVEAWSRISLEPLKKYFGI